MTPRIARPNESRSCATSPRRRKSSRSAKAGSISITCTRRPTRRKRHCARILRSPPNSDCQSSFIAATPSGGLSRSCAKPGSPPRGGVIHCFTGDINAAREFLALGFCISFSGIITFKNSAPIREAATIVPARPRDGRDGRALSRARAVSGQAQRARICDSHARSAGESSPRRCARSRRASDRERIARVQASATRETPSILTSPCPRRGRRKPRSGVAG